MQKSGIYKIINIRNGKFYLGSSKNLSQRKKKHIYELNKGTHHSSYLQNAYKNMVPKILNLPLLNM